MSFTAAFEPFPGQTYFPLEFFVRIRTWFLDLHKTVNVINYCFTARRNIVEQYQQYFLSCSWKIHFVSFRDFLYNNLMIRFNIVLCYCKELNNDRNKLLLLDENPKTRILEIQKNPNALKLQKCLQKKFLKWFGYKTIDFISY